MSLSHQQAQTYIEKRLDGPLALGAHRQLEEHLKECATCRAYASEAEAFDRELLHTLPALWPAIKTPPAKLAETVAAVQQSQRRHLVATVARVGLRAAVALFLAFFAVWFWQNQESRVEEPAFNDTVDAVFHSPELAEQYVAVHFTLADDDLPGEGVQVYHAVCDGVEYIPPAGIWARKLALGEPGPQCEIRPSSTFLLEPGERRDVLFVYKNPTAEEIVFRLVPTASTQGTASFNAELCGRKQGAGGYRQPADDEASAAEMACEPQYAPARGVWARFMRFQAPATLPPGTHITVYAHVDWHTLYN